MVVHDTQESLVSRNVAFNIDGHAFYLESGVEELTTISYNLAAHVHCIDGCAIFFSTHADITASSTRLIPADATASVCLPNHVVALRSACSRACMMPNHVIAPSRACMTCACLIMCWPYTVFAL